ncbi:facilitated trehalose transporter Tret1-like [Schistocerca nitens]|uniref:facilitated trehalose transporter Tret1-like n=1 Tax=Schistocerca nitens TaxID=7011 RepID=UPI00211854C6|nr:facilitated trehalose transporter Tret1-like [Schistocerca nitens]XP_049812663.1 facilitated trehalose transporter Tret1-like [Schistocerca nitens]
MRIPFVTTNLQYLAAFWAALTSLMSGMVYGWPSPTLPQLQQPGSWLPLTADEASWIVSCVTISSVLPIIAMPLIVDVVGRKMLLIASGLPAFASWLMVLFADSAGMLIASRVVAGLSIGASVCLVPMYVGEVAEAKVRGMLATVFQFAMCLGSLASYCMGPYMSYSAVAIVSAAVPVLFMLGFLWMPESPYFLALRGRDEEAKNALRRLRGAVSEEAIQEELGIVQKYVEEQREAQQSQLELMGKLVQRRGSRRALVVCVVLILTQVFTGLSVLTGYTTDTFQQSGVALDADVCAIIVAAVQTASSVATSLLADRAGRRPLMLLSFAGCVLTMATLSVLFYLKDVVHTDLTAVQWLPLAAMIAFPVFNILGVGPLPWAIVGEVFPSDVKGVATAVVSVVQAVTFTLMGKLFQVMSDAAGIYSVFFLFTASAFVGLVFTFFFLPETKGRTFVEITRHFEGEEQEESK